VHSKASEKRSDDEIVAHQQKNSQFFFKTPSISLPQRKKHQKLEMVTSNIPLA
jgi:hypothetical protein